MPGSRTRQPGGQQAAQSMQEWALGSSACRTAVVFVCSAQARAGGVVSWLVGGEPGQTQGGCRAPSHLANRCVSQLLEEPQPVHPCTAWDKKKKRCLSTPPSHPQPFLREAVTWVCRQVVRDPTANVHLTLRHTAQDFQSPGPDCLAAILVLVVFVSFFPFSPSQDVSEAVRRCVDKPCNPC